MRRGGTRVTAALRTWILPISHRPFTGWCCVQERPCRLPTLPVRPTHLPTPYRISTDLTDCGPTLPIPSRSFNDLDSAAAQHRLVADLRPSTDLIPIPCHGWAGAPLGEGCAAAWVCTARRPTASGRCRWCWRKSEPASCSTFPVSFVATGFAGAARPAVAASRPDHCFGAGDSLSSSRLPPPLPSLPSLPRSSSRRSASSPHVAGAAGAAALPWRQLCLAPLKPGRVVRGCWSRLPVLRINSDQFDFCRKSTRPDRASSGVPRQGARGRTQVSVPSVVSAGL